MNDYVARVNGTIKCVTILSDNELISENEKYHYDLLFLKHNSYALKLNNKFFELSFEKFSNDIFKILINGYQFDVTIRTALQEKAFKLLESSSKSNTHHTKVKAPMPGLILKISRNVGDQVEIGETVIILEAMKMENNIKANSSGRITEIKVSEGNPVEKNDILFVVE